MIHHFDKNIIFIGVESGQQCLEKLETGELPDIIFLDIFMPGMDGWDIACTIRNNPIWKNIPLVFLTTNTNLVTKQAIEKIGNAYLEKPVEANDLTNCIHKILNEK